MEICKLSDIAKFTTGKLNSNAAEPGGNYPFFTCAPEPLKIGTYAFDTQAVILAGNNAEGDFHIQYFEGKFNAYQRTYVIEVVDKTNTDIHYLFYALKMCLRHFKWISQGTATKFLTAKILNAFVLPIPTYGEQKKIAAILSVLDEKIAINRAINDNLEQQAQALFKSWFVDFEPVSTYGFIESAIGAIPCGWRIYTLSEFLPVITGKKNANVSSDKGLYPFFSCSQDFSWTNEFSFDGHAILVAGNGDFNVKWYNGKFEAYQRTYVLIPYVERYTDWLYYAVKYNLESITSAARGSVIKFITKGNLENFAFAAPENLEKCEIIDAFSSINSTIDNFTQENNRLAEIRDSLLPKLMSGEMDISMCTFTD